MPIAAHSIIDKRALSRAFSSAAIQYDRLAAWQQTVGFALLGQIPQDSPTPKVVLDLGCGTGFFLSHLQKRFPASILCAMDIAPGMLSYAQENQINCLKVCADAHALPLSDNSIGLIYANLMMQWSDSLGAVLAECRRVLAPGGAIVFSTLTANSLHELRDSWSVVCNSASLVQFASAKEIGSIVEASDFIIHTQQSERYTLKYLTLLDFFRVMKQLGTKNLSAGRAKGLFTNNKLQTVIKAYEAYRDEKGHLPVTYEVLLIHGS